MRDPPYEPRVVEREVVHQLAEEPFGVQHAGDGGEDQVLAGAGGGDVEQAQPLRFDVAPSPAPRRRRSRGS